MNETNDIQNGGIVSLHLSNGSTIPAMILDVISPTEVRLEPLGTGPGIKPSPPRIVDKPLYSRGNEPGQWEKLNSPLPPDQRAMVELFQVGMVVAQHTFQSMEVPFAPHVKSLFETITLIHENKRISSPFTEVIHHPYPFNNDGYFFSLVSQGIQEGLRSSLHFFNDFLSAKEQIQRESMKLFSFLNPTTSGVAGIIAHKLQAEYEGFVFLSRATLDRLTSFLKYYFQIKNDHVISLYALEGFLVKNYPHDPKVIQIINVINNHRVYLDTQFKGQPGIPTERNRMAHQEYVGFATPNIRYMPDRKVEVVLMYNGDLQADGAIELGKRYEALQDVVFDILRALFDLHA